ncbi:hypothetical protein ACOZ7A_002314 [Yersinia enterocolitica]|uniref:hypothetical protein n=1 Tax=Yersiniaceae TaxID=1903411 RepID=UPI00101DD3E9|nr:MULTISPECIES: hypothetical protein [Yersiniaceae]EKN4209740.1 hypothetical protein [Yersinia ruckeri]HEI6704646.1 hypothetical protein [Yersinia enterocolitica]
MGLWDNIKNAALKAKCAVGVHGGSYQLNDGESCKYSKLCPDCSSVIQTEKHLLGNEEYKFEHQCVTIRKCSRCDLEKEGEKHEEYVEIAVDDYCNVKERCVRCYAERIHGKKHSWWPRDSTETHHLYECSVCGAKKEERKTNFRS